MIKHKLVIISYLALFICNQSFSMENKVEILIAEQDLTNVMRHQTNPEWVINQIFEAAKTGKYEVLSTICDTVSEIHGDTQRICSLAGSTEGNQQQFSNYFKTGKIVVATEIIGNQARIPITYGPTGNRKETMNLIKRGNNWYLTRF